MDKKLLKVFLIWSIDISQKMDIDYIHFNDTQDLYKWIKKFSEYINIYDKKYN